MLARTLLVLLSLVIAASAQAPEERAFLNKQAASLAKFARFAFDQGYPMQARRIWQEILKEYDRDHAASRTALGFEKVGTAWQERERFDYPTADNPDGRSLTKVEKEWDKVRRAVGTAHKLEAERYHKAGRSDRAQWHFRRALRFIPEDAGVQAASGMKSFFGMTGSELEQKLYENSKRLREIVAAERETIHEVKKLEPSDLNKYLLKANIPHQGYGTKHHKVFSNMNPTLVRELAQNLERSRAFCSLVFTGDRRFNPPTLQCSTFIFLKNENEYRTALKANKDMFRPELYEFLVKHTAMCDIGTGADRAKISGDPFEAIVRDLSIRWPVDSWGAMNSDALNEGLGHAVVAMFLGRISVYSLDMEKQAHTVTNRGPGKVLLPDLESWFTMAVESAFRARGAPLAKMPLISASNFPSESRVRAWSFSDYLLRRDPRLLLALDATRKAKTIPNVRGEFHKATGLRVDALQKEWRDFWTGATPVLKALRGNRSPYGAASKDAKKWLAEFNKARKAHRPRAGGGGGRGRARSGKLVDVRWNASWSRLCRQHHEYLAANKKAHTPAGVHTQASGAKNASDSGRLFAQMALVSTKGSPSRAIKDWIHLPGYRDALLDPFLVQAGVYAQGGIAVLDVVRGSQPPATQGPRTAARVVAYPPEGATAVPRDIKLAEFGPEVAAALAAHSPGKKIGYPISLHAWSGPVGTDCTVTANGKPVVGEVPRGSANRRSAAPGMAVFFPAKPLPGRAKIEVTWKLANGRERVVGFTTK